MSDQDPKNFGSYVTGFTLSERDNMPELSFKAFIQLVEPLCKEVEDHTGIDHVLPMVQAAHESKAGNSKLAKEYGNLFGFKASKSWKDNKKPVARMPTWEVITTKDKDKFFAPFVPPDKPLPPDCPFWKVPEIVEKWTDKEDGAMFYKLKIYCYQEFRVYETWRDSFFDWGRLISTVKDYAPAYVLLRRKETVREGIKVMAGTYATDPNYARSLLLLYDKVNSGVL